MNFYVKRRPKPVLQIISMIDILIILLIFLVVTTTFKEAQSAISVSLPKSESLASSGAEEAQRLGLIVTKDEKIYLGDSPVTTEDLVSALQTAKATRPGVKLELRIDEKVPFGTLIKVWECLKNAGYKMNEVPARVMKP